MRTALFIFFCCLVSFCSSIWPGVNLSGAEFDSGTYWPTNSDIDYFTNIGLKLIRLNIKWERLQPTLGSSFSTTYLDVLRSKVNYIKSKSGARVIIDIHNYARYNGQLIGSTSVTYNHFRDLWTRIASDTTFKSQSSVFFGIMNEPHDMDSTVWKDAANHAIAAIRATGANNLIIVPGNGWDGAHSWYQNWYGTPNSDTMKLITDSGNNLAFEVHQYFDNGYSGTNPACVVSSASTVLSDVTGWARTNNKKLLLTEFGGGTGCETIIRSAVSYMASNSDVYLGWCWWAAGSAWPNDYFTSIQPTPSVKVQQGWLINTPTSAPTPVIPVASPAYSLTWDTGSNTYWLGLKVLPNAGITVDINCESTIYRRATRTSWNPDVFELAMNFGVQCRSDRRVNVRITSSSGGVTNFLDRVW